MSSIGRRKTKMQCPYCQNEETKVNDKRDSEGITRRRRECLKCEKRFTTYERVEIDLSVVKKDGRREKFNREKIKHGLLKAFQKRPLTEEQVDDVASEIEAKIYRTAKDKDITSEKIGEIIMDKLKKIDQIAYLRFASVYKEFADIDDFKKELQDLKK